MAFAMAMAWAMAMVVAMAIAMAFAMAMALAMAMVMAMAIACHLYTSDAADETPYVDFRGCRINKLKIPSFSLTPSCSYKPFFFLLEADHVFLEYKLVVLHRPGNKKTCSLCFSSNKKEK